MAESTAFSLADISTATLILVALVAYLSSIVGGLAGSGVSMLMMPLLVPLVGIKGIVPVISVAMLAGSTSRLWVFRHSVEWPVVGRILTGSVAGALIGTALYDWLPAKALYFLLGGFILFAVPARRIFERHNRRLTGGPVATAGLGLGYGVISGSLSGGGPILVAILLGMGIKGAGVVGTKAGISIVMHSVKTLAFGAFGLLNLEILLAAALIGVCTLPGAYTAKWLVERMGLRVHTYIIEGAIMIGGAFVLWQGFV